MTLNSSTCIMQILGILGNHELELFLEHACSALSSVLSHRESTRHSALGTLAIVQSFLDDKCALHCTMANVHSN